MTVPALAARAEALKLARLLGEPPAKLDYLEAADAADLAALREQVTDVLFEADRHRLKRIADAGRIVPVPVMATIGERAFGPLLCARLTGLLEPDRAAAVGRRLPPPFLARVAAELDPRRATAVITRMPVEQQAEVAALMAANGEAVAMGRFVAHLSDEALAACIDAIDEATLLRTGFVLEGKERLDQIVDLLPDERVVRLVDAVAAEGLWEEALDLLDHLGDAQLQRLGRLVAGRDTAPFAGLADVAAAHGAEAVLDRARSLGIPVA